jgi:hypothetical protein
MTNPYAAKTSEQFWKSAIADRNLADIKPIRAKRYLLEDGAVVSTAGSCFAQNVARHLERHKSVRMLKTEVIGINQPPFSALYGNIYTSRQLLQLFDEAFGTRLPAAIVWRRADGKFIDGLRPYMFDSGFPTEAAVLAERNSHLSAVRRVFTECTTFIFTLGLTEAWTSVVDQTVYPVCPGVVLDFVDSANYAFHNFGYSEILEDIDGLVARMRQVNPCARTILTVSPVPLTATYTEENVAVATMHSKSILRAVCSAAEQAHDNLFYFPAYEIIASPFSRGAYYATNRRTITEEGVAHVMRVFDATFRDVEQSDSTPAEGASARARVTARPEDVLFVDTGAEVICDEEEVVKSVGF